jgi:hypothetical protein
MPVELVRPTSALNSAWSTPTVTLIDDVVSEPSAGSGDTAYNSGEDIGVAQQWAFGAPSNSGTITSAKLWVYLKFDSNSDGSVSGCRIRFNGTWYSGTLVNQPSSGAYGWASCTISGSYGALSGSAPAFELSYSGDTPDGEIFVEVAYLDITYTAGPAERWAVATGNWSSTATWNGGTLPATTDDVYANGFTVTVDSNRTANTVRTTAGTTAVAGGGFTLSNGVTLTLTGSGSNAIAGASNCVTYSNTSGNSATLIGNPSGSNTTTNRWGAANTSSGTLNITGTPSGGSQVNAYGAINNSSGIINITGSPIGGAGSGADGVRASSGTVNIIGTPTGGAGTGGHGVQYTGTTSGAITGNPTGAVGGGCVFASSGTLSITGSPVGGSTGAGVGVLNSATGTVNISGNATGGTHALAYGASNTGTGTLTVAGTAISATAPGVNGAVGATLTSVGAAETGADGIAPLNGKVVFANLDTATYGIRNSAATLRTLRNGGSRPTAFRQQVIG